MYLRKKEGGEEEEEEESMARRKGSRKISLKEAKEIAPLLFALQTCRSQQDQKIIAKYLDASGMRHLTKAIKLVIEHGNDLQISPARKAMLKRLLNKNKRGWMALARGGGSLQQKRKFLQQEGGALGTILATAAPLIFEAIKGLF